MSKTSVVDKEPKSGKDRALNSSPLASPEVSYPSLTTRVFQGKFEFTYVSKTSVIVKELKSGKRIVLKSVFGWEIDKINIYKDR